MSETPKQRARRILDQLPIPKDIRRALFDGLEDVTEEEVGAALEAFDAAAAEDPELIREVLETLEKEWKEEHSED